MTPHPCRVFAYVLQTPRLEYHTFCWPEWSSLCVDAGVAWESRPAIGPQEGQGEDQALPHDRAAIGTFPSPRMPLLTLFSGMPTNFIMCCKTRLHLVTALCLASPCHARVSTLEAHLYGKTFPLVMTRNGCHNQGSRANAQCPCRC